MASSTSINPGFALVVNTLLSSNKNAKLLSKAKKEKAIKTKQEHDESQPEHVPQLVDETGSIVEQTVDQSISASDVKPRRVKRRLKIPKTTRQQLESIGRTKPNASGRERERQLASVATKGVVQLFNVVQQQQKQIKRKLTDAGSSGEKRSKVLSTFNEDDLLQKVNQRVIKSEDEPSSTKGSHKWKVLRDDFMTGAKFKDWDKDSESESD